MERTARPAGLTADDARAANDRSEDEGRAAERDGNCATRGRELREPDARAGCSCRFRPSSPRTAA